MCSFGETVFRNAIVISTNIHFILNTIINIPAVSYALTILKSTNLVQAQSGSSYE